MIAMLWLGLLGCEGPSGPDADTTVDELRVLAVVAEPPEVAPGGSVRLEATVVDPRQNGRDVLQWFCTPFAGACAESGLGTSTPLSQWTRVTRDAPEVVTSVWAVPPVASDLLGETALVELVQWTLACEPDLCPVIDDVEDDPAPGSEAWRDVVSSLGAPSSWMRDLPLQGVSLAGKRILLSRTPPGQRNENPDLEVVPAGPFEVAPGEFLSLEVRSDGAAAHPFATAGAFNGQVFGLGAGEVDMVWEAPRERGEVRLVIAVEDGLGGSAVWRATAFVR